MKIKSFSKINLTLRVLKKLKNGMHDIETNSVLVSFFDEISIKKNIKDRVVFKGKFKNKIDTSKNTVTKTLKILRKLKILKNFYKIVIKKNIPIFAGLGGGTGNSASIVKYFLKDNINEEIIKICEEKIGSDFRLFLNNCSFQKSLGKVFKTKNRIKLFLILVFPHINCKTKVVYKSVKNFSAPSGSLYQKKISQKKFIEIIKRDRNDLQTIIEKKYSKISPLLKLINKQQGCNLSRMTGSGSVCYGVFSSKKTAKFAMTKLKRKYPKYWCVITKTI